ncbi:YdcF family protein [Aquirufa rosea]|nr:YdcF family protein [Aquirufa rosea]
MKKGIGISILIFFLLTNSFICNSLLKLWEIDAPDIPIGKKYTWGIVLTGGMVKNADLHPNRIAMGQTSDRMLQTFHLYQQGAIKKILITGGSTSIPNLIVDDSNESANVKRQLVAMGVPSKNIFVENKAKNTYQNALYSAQKLKNYIDKDSVVLITSANHLRRAILCFEKQGFKVRPYSADIQKKDTPMSTLHFIKPNEQCLDIIFKLNREWVGIVVYKLQGYL